MAGRRRVSDLQVTASGATCSNQMPSGRCWGCSTGGLNQQTQSPATTSWHTCVRQIINLRATCLKRNAVRDRPKLTHSVFVVIECGARLTHFYEYVVSASRAPCDNVASASIAAVVANDLFQSPRFPPRSTSLCRGFSLYLSLSLSPSRAPSLHFALSPSLSVSLCISRSPLCFAVICLHVINTMISRIGQRSMLHLLGITPMKALFTYVCNRPLTITHYIISMGHVQ